MPARPDDAAREGAAGKWRGRLRGLGLFLLAFVLAFALAWLLLRTEPGEGAAAAGRAVEAGAWRDFLAAAARDDFPALRDLGGRLMVPGAVLDGDMAEDLADFEINGLPPNRVYLLHASIGGKRSSRVLLTLGPGNRVASFLAEETAVAAD